MPVLTTQSGEVMVLQLARPGMGMESIGVLLRDPESDHLYIKLRRDWEELAEEESDWLQALHDDLEVKAREMGAGRLLEYLEENASNILRVTDRERVMVTNFDSTLQRLFTAHVSPKVLPFRTHLPKYTLRAAAGKFGEQMEVEPEEWEEAPEDLRLTEDMFVAHVVGRSMEPRIKDGSLCVFRGNVVGSRNGRLVLVMHYGETGENRFTIKRYHSTKSASDEAEWRQDRIVLEPLNPEYEPWELEEGSPIKVIGEFVRVLREP